MTSYSSQYFGSAKPIVNQTNAGVNSLVAQISGGGGGGSVGPNPVVSTITVNGGIQKPDIITGETFLTTGSSLVEVATYSSTLSFVAWKNFTNNTDNPDVSLNISTGLLNFPYVPQPATYLEINADQVSSASYIVGGYGTAGTLDVGALSDGRSFIGASVSGVENSLSTLLLIADSVNISSLNVSSINGATPGATLPQNASFNTLGVSSINVSTINMNGFIQPLITYGANQLDGTGTAIIGLDHLYTIPYYPFVTYKATLPANTSTLSVSTIDGESFAVFGEANMKFNYMVVGN